MKTAQEKIMGLIQHDSEAAKRGAWAWAEAEAVQTRPELVPGSEAFYQFVLEKIIK